jgi:beta-lactamase superfamily II metal-dependent hydrolase
VNGHDKVTARVGRGLFRLRRLRGRWLLHAFGRPFAVVVALTTLGSCSKGDRSSPRAERSTQPVASADDSSIVPALAPAASPAPLPTLAIDACGGGRRLTVHFYDVGQALSALVDLPDGRHVLVDAGDMPRRPPGCERCRPEEPLLRKLEADLHGAPIDLLWITHQHADHLGGAAGVLHTFRVGIYADNGRDASKAEVKRTHRAAREAGAAIRVVDRGDPVPIHDSPDVALAAELPATWPESCAHDPNECSIGLRIDYCASSVLFTGDAEHDEEARLDPGEVTLLQVGHHGSETSTTPGFLAKTRPRYAVISAGKPGEGMNRDYCHPRAGIDAPHARARRSGVADDRRVRRRALRPRGPRRLARGAGERPPMGDRARRRRGSDDDGGRRLPADSVATRSAPERRNGAPEARHGEVERTRHVP